MDGLARHWTLDPDVTFLNHGLFGACPRVVLETQARLRAQIEREPVSFFIRGLEGMLDEAFAALGNFVGADPADLVAVPNATAGVNTVLRSLELAPGDELVTTDHAYNACRNALEFVAARARARVVVAEVPFPIAGPGDALDAILGRVSQRTRLALIDHVTSPTALVLPVPEIVRELSARGVDTLVDAAHAPGMLPLDLDATGAAYTTGNLHKWVCAPKGAAFLHVRRDKQAGIRPLSISHGANSPRRDRSRFRLEFDWTGTDDPTPLLCVPEALRFLGSLLPGGIPELQERNHTAAVEARGILCGALGVDAPCPDAMLGSMASAALPPTDGLSSDPLQAGDPLQEALFTRHRVEIPVFPWPAPPRRMIRASTPIYVTRAHVERLADCLRELGVGRR